MQLPTRHGQLKMGESFAVLVVFFILLAIGLIFYGAIQRTSVQEQREEGIDKRAIQVAQAASFLPEIQCSRSEEVTENCFDLYKLIGLNRIAQRPQAFLGYRTAFGNSRIVVEEIYPERRTWTIYDAAISGAGNYTTRISTFIPVALMNVSVRPETFTFGYLNVTLYE